MKKKRKELVPSMTDRVDAYLTIKVAAFEAASKILSVMEESGLAVHNGVKIEVTIPNCRCYNLKSFERMNFCPVCKNSPFIEGFIDEREPREE